MKALILSEMIWSEVEAAKENIEIVLIPVGSCEQHGPNMTFETDTARAYEFAKLIGEQMGDRALIVPPIAYGMSAHHMAFPGTITLRSETFINLCKDIVVCLSKHGFKKFGFLNGHGGNNGALDIVVNDLKHEHGLEAFYTPMGVSLFKDAIRPEWNWSEETGHACEAEGSQGIVLCPWIIRDERVPGEIVEYSIKKGKDNLFKMGGTYAIDWKRDFTNNGALGDARKINAEYGKICNDIAIKRVLALIEGFLKMK